jgi:hypothetical protein
MSFNFIKAFITKYLLFFFIFSKFIFILFIIIYHLKVIFTYLV